MKFYQPIITREHGSWAVLFVPMIIALSCTGTVGLNDLLLALSALGVFMSYVPLHIVLREFTGTAQNKEKLHASYVWGSVYLCAALLFIVPLFLHGYEHLITFAILGSVSFFGNYILATTGQKNITSDLMAVAGLTLSAPSMYYVSTGLLDTNAFILWVLNFLFFGSSVFYVHMKIRVTGLKKEYIPLRERLTIGKMNIFYHVIVVGIVIVLSLYRYTPLTALLAFAPMIIHALYGTLRLSSKVHFKKLGLLLLAQSIIFSFLLVLAWM